MTNRILTIFLADIVGFSALTATMDRMALLGLIEEFRNVVADAVGRRNGRIIKFIGDGALVLFENASDAALAGLDLIALVRGREIGTATSPRFDLRVILHSGEVTMTEDDIFGETVNIAFRIEEDAPAGQLTLSEATVGAMEPGRLDCTEVGLKQFKGIREPIRLFCGRHKAGEAGRTIDVRTRPPTVFDLTMSRGDLVVERFELKERLPAGTLGPVYLAVDHVARAERILRLVEPFRSWSPVETRDRCRAFLDRLVSIDHPRVARCHEYGIAFESLFISTEPVAGQRLSEKIISGRPFASTAAARLLRHVVEGLAACHKAGVCHGELAPYNIVLVEDRPVLLDPGHLILARMIGRGSPWPHDYLSPEEAADENVDFRSDLYSLGAIAFELVTGEKPFIESSARKLVDRHRFSPPPAPRTRQPGLPREWDDLVLSLMAKEPDRRLTVAETIRRLELLASPPAAVESPVETVDPARLAEKLHLKARDLFEINRPDEARAPLAELLEKVDPSHARGWNLLGVIELKAKRHSAAIPCFVRAFELDGGYLEAVMNLGLACHESRRVGEAANAYAAATRIKPDNVRAWIHLGECQLALRDLPAAAASWEKALQLEPGNAPLRERLASLRKAMA